jgi:hypothetical protein
MNQSTNFSNPKPKKKLKKKKEKYSLKKWGTDAPKPISFFLTLYYLVRLESGKPNKHAHDYNAVEGTVQEGQQN